MRKGETVMRTEKNRMFLSKYLNIIEPLKMNLIKSQRHSKSKNIASLLFLLIIIFSLIPLLAQENQEGFVAKKLLVLVDSSLCPVEVLKQNITFAEFVTKKEKANVVVEISQEQKERQIFYHLSFNGQQELEGKKYELSLNLPEGTESARIQQELTRTIKLGLIPFAVKTEVAPRLKIKLQEQVKPTAVVDPWNFWVFSLSANSFLNGQKSYSYQSLYGNFSANRVTPEWKIRLSVNASYYRNSFDYEGTSYVSTSQGQSFRGLVAKSLGEHWSVGAFATVMTSTYQNLKFKTRISPAIEYNIFPYSESTKRQLRITYSLDFGPAYYREETIFDKTREFLVSESASITLEHKKKWGTIGTSIESSHYFHDFSKYRIELNTDLSVRLFKGFSLNIYGGYSRIHDLISIPKAGTSWEDVLLMRKQLATSYNYYFSVGLSYSFGSIFSNVVNPRFGSGFSISMSY